MQRDRYPLPLLMSSTTKRHRQSSSSSSSSTATGAPAGSNAGAKQSGTPKPQHHPAKSCRVVSPTELSPPRGESGPDGGAGRRHPLLCTLPPTCAHRPTPLANTKELESHYATCHAHVCEQKGCGCVFPEARLLELVSRMSVCSAAVTIFGFLAFYRVS